MKKKFIVRFTFILVLLASLSSFAQIYEPDGLRMPGDWNSWVNDPGMGGDFDLHKINSGTPRWSTSFLYTHASGVNNFKFVSTSFGNPWGNQWAGNTAFALNTLSTVNYGSPADPNNQISLTQNKWYTVIFEDKGYAGARAVFMQTSAQPVSISGTTITPMLPAAMQAVQVSAVVSSVPSPEEKFFVRYTTDNWSTSIMVSAALTGTTLTATIPGMPSATEVSCYVFSSTLANPAPDFDLLTLKADNNNGSNFNYTVDQVIECGNSQSLLSSEPAFPLENEPITIYFNAAFGNGGLFGFEGDVYTHTGVITNLSTGPTDWKYVKTEWGVNTPETKLTRISDNLYSFTINNIRTYYNVPSGEQIKKLAFVFRSAEEQPGGYYLEHKNADGSDIFLDVYSLSLNVKITSPSRTEPLVSPNAVLPVCVSALSNTSISLYLDNALLTSENTSSLTYPLILQSVAPGLHWLKATATANSAIVADSIQIYLRGPVVVEELPQGVKNGVNYIDNSTVTLVLNDPAALKNFAFVIGENTNWMPTDAGYMKRTPDGKHYWITLQGLQSGKEYAYQYYIDGNLKLADTYTHKILDPWNDKWIPAEVYPSLKAYPFGKTTGAVSVFQTNQAPYTWQVPNFTPEAVNSTQSDLVIYELLIRDFVETHSISAVKEKISYLKSLGVNAIELMPIMEFDGNDSWGYSPNFFFAPDKYYGTSTAYKQFIDECHKNGISVILDIVTNHAFGQCPMVQMYFNPNAPNGGAPASNNPWFNQQATHPFSVGYDFNHESTFTRQFIKDVFSYWLTEFKVDGFRLDLSKGLTQKNTGEDVGAWSQYDQSRINILTDYYNHIKSVDADAYVILEHLGNNDEQTVLANAGMLPWSGMHDNYKQLGMGWVDNSNTAWAYHANRGWNYPNLIDYMENHDEERLMFENLSYGNSTATYNIKDTLTSVKHLEQAALIFMGTPGPKMIWQFGELGYDYSIESNGGRTSAKPPRWDYINNESRIELYSVYAAMAKLRKSDAFRFGSYSSDLNGEGKRMWVNHSSMNVVMATNMGVNTFDMAPGFPNAGTWYDYFTGESIQVSNASAHTLTFAPGQYRVFTSVALPVPFYKVEVSVTDSTDGKAVAGAKVKFPSQEAFSAASDGTVTLMPAPGTLQLTVSKPGYKNFVQSYSVNSAKQISIKLKRDAGFGISDENTMPNVQIFPNPAQNLLYIKAEQNPLLRCYNTQGQMVMEHQMQQGTESVDISQWQPGMYLVVFSYGLQTGTIKLIKQ